MISGQCTKEVVNKYSRAKARYGTFVIDDVPVSEDLLGTVTWAVKIMIKAARAPRLELSKALEMYGAQKAGEYHLTFELRKTI